MPQQLSYTTPEGLTLYAKAYGSADAGPPVICLHGLTRNHCDFEPLIACLPEWHYVAMDMRGRGLSSFDPEPSRYNIDQYATDVIAFADALDIPAFFLIGTSMGGLIANAIGARCPSRVLGVVLNDIGPRIETAGLARIAAYGSYREALESWSQAAAVVKAVFPRSSPLSENTWLDIARRTFREEGGKIVVNYDTAIFDNFDGLSASPENEPARWALFEKLYSMPLLLIRGDISDILPAPTAQTMIDVHPDARLVTVPGVGHAPLLDEPEAVHGIDSFLKTAVDRLRTL